jgi:hypothetical protein
MKLHDLVTQTEQRLITHEKRLNYWNMLIEDETETSPILDNIQDETLTISLLKDMLTELNKVTEL